MPEIVLRIYMHHLPHSSPTPPPEVLFITKLSHSVSLSHVQLSVTRWTAACQASLSINNSQSLCKLMSIESVMPSNHLILCHPLLLLPSLNLSQHQGLFK